MVFTRYADAFAAAAPWFARVVVVAMCAVLAGPSFTFLRSGELPGQEVFAASVEEANETVAPAPGPTSAPAEDSEDESPELEESLPWDHADDGGCWHESRPVLRVALLDLHPESLKRPDARPPEVA